MKATTPASSRSNVPSVCRLIVNADDYGHGAGVSAGIRAAHLNGIVSSTTAMMNQPDAGAELLRARAECPHLGLGVHLVLTMGAPLLPAAQVRSLLGYAGNFPKLAALQQHCAQIAPAELHAEWRAQIEAFLASGCAADHLDSHHHASYQHPLLLETMLQLAQEYHLPIRHPLDAGVPPQMPAAAQALLAQYCSVDGMPNDWHLVHLGSRAVGGAALVMTEMTCVSPEGRITPGCTGLWSSKQADEWSRIVTFVHDQTQSLIGMQLGHSGRKGSTRVAWQGMDLPLESENWSLLAPSAVPYLAESVVPKAMTRSDMDLVRDQFVHATKLATQAKFDLLEVHAAHGYLLSSFLSPITNKREDEYGGSLENRMRYPLEVISCVRAAWPDHLPLSVRISATDWIDGGFDGNQATQFARQLQQIGVDIIDVSTGEVDRAQQPAYGRLYQTPFADRIRQEVGIPTMTVGGVSSVDDVNTIILAGRADLCLMARPHLVDPYWTLNAAIDQGYEEIEWPRQYLSGKTARRRDQSAI